VSKTKFALIVSNAACLLVCVSMLAPAGASAATPASAPVDPAATAQTNQIPPADDAPSQVARPLVNDDPVAIRDALAKHPLHATSPTLRQRIGKLIPLPGHAAPRDANLARDGLDRELVFLVPVPYGVLYESRTHELSVDADLSGDDRPGSILLKKSVTGPSGRDLVIAPEAKEKGYIQQVDLIELKADGHGKTMIHGHFAVPQAAFDKTHGDFSVEVRCALVPPYLKDQHAHTDPTDENPTDITTRTSTLYADVHAIWLISPQSATVLTKKLRLSN
jgi:hypothetical protein